MNEESCEFIITELTCQKLDVHMHIKKNTQSVLDIIIADHNLLFFWFVTCLFKNFH